MKEVLYRKKLKLVFPILLAVAMTFGALSSIFAAANTKGPMGLTQISYSFSSSSGNANNYTFYYSDHMILQDARQESGDIAKLSVALAMAAYGDTNTNIKSVLERLGFDYIVSKNYDRKATLEDNDFVAYTIALKTFEYNGQLYEVFFVPVRGTPGSAEWFSDFNLGESGKYHAGFRMAADEVRYDCATTYQTMHNDKAETIILCTGHSRGAAVANLLAGRLTASGAYASPDHIFGYTYACPAVEKDLDAFTNIYNYNNTGDLIPELPLEKWGYDRYGITKQICTSALDSSEYANVAQRFKAETGKTFYSTKDTDEYLEVASIFFDSEMTFNEASRQFAVSILAYGLGGYNGNDLVVFVPYLIKKTGNNYIKDQIHSYAGLANFIYGADSELSDAQSALAFLQSAYKELDGCTEEEFERWKNENAASIKAAEKIADVAIDKLASLHPAIAGVKKAYEILDFAQKAQSFLSLFLDAQLHPASAIIHGHEPMTYVLGINSMFHGYKGHYGYTADAQPLEIEAKTTYVGDYAFYGTKYSKLTIENGLTKIGNYAFYGCTGLTEVIIPDSVTSIGDGAFAGCTSIIKLTMPVDATYNTSTSGFATNTFFECVGIEEVYYTYGQTGVMQDYAVNATPNCAYTATAYANDSLVSVTFEDGITYIGKNALRFSKVKNVVIPSRATLPSLHPQNNYSYL